MHEAAPKLEPMAEARRLAVLDSYAILDTPRESAFDDITRIASAICGSPIALISLVGTDRQWFKSEVGLGISQTPIDQSFCAHALLEHDMLVVTDPANDPRFAGNPLVTGDLGLKFYAGALLKTADGAALGTLCVLDTVDRTISEDQLASLQALARQTMAQLELRRLLRETERTSQYRARLLAAAGHDLRTPLMVAMLSIDNALRDSPAQHLKRLSIAQEALGTIRHGFNTLLSGASGHSTFSLGQFAPVNLGELLASVFEAARPAAERKSIRLDKVPTCLSVHSDRAQLETLVSNLVTNALKYTARGGRVLFGCRRSGEHVQIQILDTGIGMNADVINDMFGAFRQADTASEGLGLGLWIVKTTAEALGIDIAVHSVPDKGTRFVLNIPRDAAQDLLDRSAEPGPQADAAIATVVAP
jgi:signal transduction histidine kinase